MAKTIHWTREELENLGKVEQQIKQNETKRKSL